MHAILLIYDESEKKASTQPGGGKEADCHCVRNNSIDRAKILIRYLRKQLKFRKAQITFLRTSRFASAEEARHMLENLFDKHQGEDMLFYYAGHGIAGRKLGWSFGKWKKLHYRSLRMIFRKFHGQLVFINDCCYALAIDQHLKLIPGKYLLMGPCRRGCVTSESILDSILGYWFCNRIADPKVASVAKLKTDTTGKGLIFDTPAYASRGSYYNCECGDEIKVLKFFGPSNAPSLRRGAELDSIWFPK